VDGFALHLCICVLWLNKVNRMKKIASILFSSRLMAVILVIFAVSIATATFIENDFGSQTARATVYNSWWFSAMLFIGIINLTGTIWIRKLYQKEKRSLFIFHLAFLFILLGAAITHFFGFEGFMHIRDGDSSNQIVSDNTYLTATVTVNGQTASAEKQIYFSALSDNYHKLRLKADGKAVDIECTRIIPNAQETIANDPKGMPILELVLAGNSGKQTLMLTSGQTKKIGELPFSFNDSTNMNGVNIVSRNGNLDVKAPVDAMVMDMATQHQDTIRAHSFHPFKLRTLYNFEGIQVVAKSFNPSGRIEVNTSKEAKRDELPDALYLRIRSEGQSKSIVYFASHNALNHPAFIKLNDISASVSFGAKIVPLPFSLQLKRFILERYPGSNSPSWFESRVLLNDSNRGVREEHRIFMNNVLKYRGYRFFQSSYDSDEQGTIFSVNHDYWGTLVTYFGYLMLALGIVLSILNRNSRFRKLSTELTRLREARKTAFLAIIFSVTLSAFPTTIKAQSTVPDSVYIDKQQAARFGELFIQDPGGRIKPINSLSSELLRKISRKTGILGQTSDQVLLGMIVYPEYWQKVPMIKVSHPGIMKILHVQRPYVSFDDVIDQSSPIHPYLLNDYVNDAYQKKPGSRGTFDTEIIHLDERINLCYQIYSGDLLRIFPKRSDPTQTWYTPINCKTAFTGKDSLFTTSIIAVYARTLRDATVTKNLKLPDEALGVLHDFQTKAGGDLIPSPLKTKVEILYNRLNIFDKLGSIYGLVGFVLLILQFVTIFAPRLNLKALSKAATIIIILCFAAHLAGLAARWYISGHAPWSNAYESLIYIAFATILAGLIFSRKSGMTLAVTALLAWLILFVAHLNWMDPEITNLVPVLKSYWLLIHVAIITASYGFLALGALLAFINLILMISQTKANFNTTGSIIAEITIVIEMTLIIGLYMITIGMFLGGVWANESWGRYWGWDSKETWALVSVLVYAFVAHMRMVPGLKGTYIFNLMALLGFSSIIMTYFGVNYYLSGLHSYAKGDPFPIPTFVYYTIGVVGLVAIAAWGKQKRLGILKK
jgi:cytochrome c-type biogenesis protein CcsB